VDLFTSDGPLECTGFTLAAKNAFCCYLPVNIPKLNLLMAVLSTVAFIFIAVSVRNLPPTPPAASGEAAKNAPLFETLKRMFKN